jgi:hypothetical protein
MFCLANNSLSTNGPRIWSELHTTVHEPKRLAGTDRNDRGLTKWRVVLNHTEKAATHRDGVVAMVVDKTELPKLVHEMADPRSGSSDHLGQVFLIDFGTCRSVSTFRAQLRKLQKNPGQAFLAEIEESIRKVFFNSTHTGKQVDDNKL